MEREDTVRKCWESRSHAGTQSRVSKHRLQRKDVSFDDSSSVFNSLIAPYHETADQIFLYRSMECFNIFWLTFLV